MSFVLAEIEAVFTAPLLITLGKDLYTHTADALTMQILSNEIHPFLTAVFPRRTGEELVCVRKSDIEQREIKMFFCIVLILLNCSY
jgi:hypothetical protein